MMVELRKKRSATSAYQVKPIIRCAKKKQSVFIVSKLILKQMDINPETDGIMFGFKDKKLHIFKELKESDNYHLSVADANTMRFRSNDLFEHISKHFGKQDFTIELQNDLTFKLI
jgi:hypothetical protein